MHIQHSSANHGILVRNKGLLQFLTGEGGGGQGWHSGENTYLSLMWSNPGVDTICGLSLLFALSLLLREVYLRVLWFSFLLKKQHFQIPIQPEMVDEGAL